MAVIHHTTLVPSKLELLTGWLPSRPWYLSTGQPPLLARTGGFRLDDPEGEVGIEFLVATDTSGDAPAAYLVPLTYRSAPLDGAEQALVGTSEHGVLGRRWVYDAVHDPVFTAELYALLRGDAEPQAQSVSDTPDRSVAAELHADGHAAPLQGSAVADRPDATDLVLRTAGGPLAVRVHRLLRTEQPGPAAGRVTADWGLPDGTRRRGPFVTVLPA